MFVTAKFCISIVFSFPWGHFISQEKMKTLCLCKTLNSLQGQFTRTSKCLHDSAHVVYKNFRDLLARQIPALFFFFAPLNLKPVKYNMINYGLWSARAFIVKWVTSNSVLAIVRLSDSLSLLKSKLKSHLLSLLLSCSHLIFKFSLL